MKGIFANSQSLFAQKLLNNLYPSGQYSHSSSGFPLSIPTVSWPQLKQFHTSHYHPSNARILSYGSLSLPGLLDRLTPHLEKFSRQPAEELAAMAVGLEQRWTEPRCRTVVAPPDTRAPHQSSLAVAWLLADTADRRLALALRLLTELLAGSTASPLYQALIQSGLAASFSPLSGYEDHTKETNWILALQGVDLRNKDKILQIIEDTLEIVIKEGFELEQIEAILHSYELRLKEKSTNFGMNLILSLVPFWNHSDSPIEFLMINQTLNWLKEKLSSQPTFLQNLADRYLKNNPHKLVQTMIPDDNFTVVEQAKLAQLESELCRGLSAMNKAEIHRKAVGLAALQGKREDTSCLPSLRLADIRDDTEEEPEQLTRQSNPVQLVAQPTNQLTQFRALLDTQTVPANLQPLLSLFSLVLTRLGAAELTGAALDAAVALRTGGLTAEYNIQPDPVRPGHLTQSLLLSSHCLGSNIPAMFDLWTKVFTSTQWEDSGRLGRLVQQELTSILGGLGETAHKFAITGAASRLSAAGWLTEQVGGIAHIRQLVALAQMEPAIISENLKTIAAHLLNKNRMRCSLNTNDTEASLAGLDTFLSSVDGNFLNESPTIKPNFIPESAQTHIVTPFSANFTSQCVSTVCFTHPDHARLPVLAALITARFLQPELRKAGAYSGGASAGNGTFTFYSYRDPHSLGTFSLYQQAAKWAVGANYSQAEVERAVLQVVQAAVSPASVGQRLFLTGVTNQLQAQHRSRLLAVRKEDLQEVACRYLMEPQLYGRTILGKAQPGLQQGGWVVENIL